ncbi:Broad-complex core protein isoform 6 [Armadillidium vulgare]|nr:Broad-complex core protein isoform 6 [Armadillidium vulgare]
MLNKIQGEHQAWSLLPTVLAIMKLKNCFFKCLQSSGAMEEVATMPSNAQEFCLRWNNFHSSLVSALDGFKNDLDFVDVTLACEGQFLKAHKMLLSACSVFFRDLLKANPYMLFSEVRFIDLEKMLRFIYQYNVQQENLARFLKTAEMLKIRGKEFYKQLHQDHPEMSGNGSTERCNNDASAVSPKRPRLSLDAQSGQSTDQPQTPNDESRLSGPDSDSEMIPVKQEMIELKECDFESADSEAFLAAETCYLRENSVGTTNNSSSNNNNNSSISSSNNNSSSSSTTQPPLTHPAAPPPPGPLLPSYVPPPQIKAQDGMSRSSSHPVGGLIRRFLEECLQLPDPAPLLATYSGLEGTPHFQLLRSVAKEWSYCRNATQNYSTLGGSSKRQRATSRLIETFENIDTLRNELAHLLHAIIVIEITMSGTVKKICKAEQSYVQQQQQQLNQQAQQGSNGENPANIDVVNREFVIMDIEGVSAAQQEEFKKATEDWYTIGYSSLFSVVKQYQIV